MCGKFNIFLFQIIQNEVLLDIDTHVFETSHRQALLWGNIYLLLQELSHYYELLIYIQKRLFFCVLIFLFKVFCALPNSHSCTGVCASLYFYDNLGKEITFVKVGIWISNFCCCVFWETKYQTYF